MLHQNLMFVHCSLSVHWGKLSNRNDWPKQYINDIAEIM